jgi:hypothetical protein
MIRKHTIVCGRFDLAPINAPKNNKLYKGELSGYLLPIYHSKSTQEQQLKKPRP